MREGKPMDEFDLLQGTEAWRQARCGSLGASQIAEALAKTKTGWGAGRANVMATLIVERLTGEPTPSYVSPAMQWGTDNEADAVVAYSFHRDMDVSKVGLVRHPSIAWTHASPDGLVSDDGLIEVKCPLSATHIETLISGSIPGKYQTQMDWQMACTGRSWCDFVSFDPRLPEDMRLFVRRWNADAERIAQLTADVTAFLAEVDAKMAALIEAVRPAARAA
jgi:putative phage-type endonuclease